jgi:hypothetical protein
MRIFLYSAGVLVLGLTMTACSQDENRSRRNEPAAREAGREAARASQDIKQSAKKAADQLKDAGKEFKQGWEEGKREQTGSANRRRDQGKNSRTDQNK